VAAIEPKVEVGFDLTNSPIGPFFRLNSSVTGRLNNTEYRLGGTIFYDITDRVRDISITRGKPRRFASFPAAIANISFNNHDRAFDPLYVDSPFFGNIIPRRQIRVSMGDAIAFTGWIDDWNFAYTPDGNSIADATSLDATTILAQQTIAAGIPIVQLTGARIQSALDLANWSPELRTIEIGTVDCGVQEIPESQNVLSYIQSVAQTEAGLLFVAKDGHVAFRSRRQFPRSTDLVTFDQSGGIPYSGIGIVYGSELLFNEVTIANVGGATATASSPSSIETYGARQYNQTDLLGNTDQQSVDLAVYYADLYAEPEYRVETLEVKINDIEPEQQAQVFGLEIGSVCKVSFTPNNIGDPIEKFLQVIRIEHAKTPQFHDMVFGFQEIKYLGFVLNDEVFGKLDEGTLV
jgi:hypothetical protein